MAFPFCVQDGGGLGVSLPFNLCPFRPNFRSSATESADRVYFFFSFLFLVRVLCPTLGSFSRIDLGASMPFSASFVASFAANLLLPCWPMILVGLAC